VTAMRLRIKARQLCAEECALPFAEPLM
jgi:hypothetical protein